MRLPIREQLGILILLSALIGLAVVSIATWSTNYAFVTYVRHTRLSLVAALKAAQLASNLGIMQTATTFVGSRVLIQQAITRYNLQGNNSADNWAAAQLDMNAAIGGSKSLGQSILLQVMLFPRAADGPNGPYSLLNATASTDTGIVLPLVYPNGTKVHLGDEGLGYPANLYPNLTYMSDLETVNGPSARAEYNGFILDYSTPGLVLGPWTVNSTFSVVSITGPIVNNTSDTDVLGWLSVILDASLIIDVQDSTEGLGNTGETLIVSPSNTSNNLPSTNHFPSGIVAAGRDAPDFPVRYALDLPKKDASRHPNHVYGTANAPFNASAYPAIWDAVTQNSTTNALLTTHNEDNRKVSVGYATTQTDLVDWVILIEYSHAEIWRPIAHLRDIILACVFATAAFLAVIAFPLAHFAVLPIRRLRDATKRSIEPAGGPPSPSSLDSFDFARTQQDDDSPQSNSAEAVIARKEGYRRNPVARWRQKRQEDRQARRDDRRKHQFRIPGKVKERKVAIKDELSDLTSTFNEMSDELMMQYERLEERVQQRTAELELSKKAAEAANESKTLFIANISHELKTPLNGILGMCAVCMQEDDPIRLKRSLGIIYKSGDLLLNLLTDLLTFSKNQVGQHLSLDEKEFRMRDISSQVLAIFDKQAKDGQIDLRVAFEGSSPLDAFVLDSVQTDPSDPAASGAGRTKDMILWGDQHRILQVVINLVSNSLKFTPPGGSVVITIRCLPDLPDLPSRKTSMQSKQSRQSRQHSSGMPRPSGNATPPVAIATALMINARDKSATHISLNERAASPPPGRYLSFEFEVQDSGPGISENLQQRIFEPFVQGDLGLSKKYGGTGLGLSICSQLASLMRGTVGVKSTVGVGSTFTMQIPLRHIQSRAGSSASSTMDLSHDGVRSSSGSFDDNEPRLGRSASRPNDIEIKSSRSLQMDMLPNGPGSPGPVVIGTASESQNPRLVGLSQPFFATTQPMESPGAQTGAMEKITQDAAQGGRIRVLVAEDNKVNQEVVLRMLKLEDIYDVTIAKDGQEALDMVKESMQEHRAPFNLIFMDIQMPNVDGLTSTRLIREIGYDAPIVALTAFAEESNIKDCLDSGMNYFLSKPIRRPQLKKVLKQYCAPIPEEKDEDLTPSPVTNVSNTIGQGTKIVMVDGGQQADQKPAVAAVSKSPERDSHHPHLTNGMSNNAGNNSEPVSPLSGS